MKFSHLVEAFSGYFQFCFICTCCIRLLQVIDFHVDVSTDWKSFHCVWFVMYFQNNEHETIAERGLKTDPKAI